MATKNSQKGLSASILAGSEEIIDFPCQPCSTDNLQIEAVGYCQDCCEYLCDNCCNAHRKLSATKHHTMLDKSAMSKSKLRSKAKDVLQEKCSIHEEKILEYFCNDHTQLCCSVCVNMQHRHCLNMAYVPEVSNGIANSREYKQLRTDLDRLLSSVTERQKDNNRKNEDNKKYHSKALANIKRFRQQINRLLDTLVNETTAKISDLNLVNLENIQIESDACQSIITDVNTMVLCLEKSVTFGKDNQLFVEMKKSRARLLEIQSEPEAVDAKIKQYSFNKDETIQQMMSSLSAIWSLSVRQDDTSTTARYVQEVNVKSKDDSKKCSINGIAILTGDRVVVSDSNNSNVKLIDMMTNELTSCLSMSSEPFDVIGTKPNQVTVALRNEKKLEIITVSDVLIRSHSIDTPGASIVGLCYDGSHYISSCQQPVSVKIVDISGRTLRTLNTDNNDKDLFTMPRYIAIGRDKDVIYVTDSDANTVTTMTTGGHVISVYRHMLKNPSGVAVDKDGTVYVISKGTHNVHQLSPTGDLTRIVLRLEQELVHSPQAIAYSAEDDILYISSNSTALEECNYIRLYQLEYRL